MMISQASRVAGSAASQHPSGGDMLHSRSSLWSRRLAIAESAAAAVVVPPLAARAELDDVVADGVGTRVDIALLVVLLFVCLVSEWMLFSSFFHPLSALKRESKM